jgi:hypothetical protein
MALQEDCVTISIDLLRDIEALLDDALDGHLIHRRPETYEIAAHLRRALISTDAPVHMTLTAVATAHV